MKVRTLRVCALLCLAAAIAWAQDAAKVDPKHYKVEFENSEVQVLRIHYGPHEKSVMHSHPAGVVVYLSDGNMRFNMADGKVVDASGKKGETLYTPAVVHMPEDTGDAPFDAVLVELKGKKQASEKTAMK
jgi:quercetin dioxygenase-like cupin family protein